MKKNKKLLMFLALNSLATSFSGSTNQIELKYDKLYTSMVKNIEIGKSNEKNYKLIQDILDKRNEELKDLYAQGDYIVKPEYLEWQIFFSGFYNKKNRGHEDEKVNNTDLRTPKLIQIGAAVPIKTVTDFDLGLEVNVSRKEIIPETIAAPTAIPKLVAAINIPDITLPEINVVYPLPFTSPQIVSPDINIRTGITIPQVVLPPITVVSFGLPFFNSIDTSLSYVWNPTSGVNSASYTLNPADTRQSVLTLSNSKIATVNSLTNTGTLNVNKTVTRGMEVDEPNTFSESIINNGTINISNTLVVGMEGRGPSKFNTGSQLVQDHNSYVTNNGTITGIAGNGTVINQAALSIGMDGSVAGTRVQMTNTATGVITMNAPQSIGIQLRPDDNKVVQQGYNNGNMSINGYRSYGMMTTLGTGSSFLNQNPTSPNETSRLLLGAGGVINVNGDESTGLAILVPINEWGGTGTVNVGVVDPNQNPVNGDLYGNVHLVQGAAGLYTNQAKVSVNCATTVNITGLCGLAEMTETGTINVGTFAFQSSGVRVEGSGFAGNSGTININGNNNYGAVVVGNGTFDNHVWTPSGNASNGKIYVNSNNSIGIFTNGSGTTYNQSLIKVNGNSSIGMLINNGTGSNLGLDGVSTNYTRGDALIETTGSNSHGVILTKLNSALNTVFTNTGHIKNNSEETIGIYAEKGAVFTHNFMGTTSGAQTAEINSGNGAIGIYVKDVGTVGNIGAPIITGDSTTKTSIAVVSDGNSVINFTNTELGTQNQAQLKLGQNAVGLYSIDGTKFSNTFKINGLTAELGQGSVLGYISESTVNVTNLDNIKVNSMGANSVLLYGANNSDLFIDSNLILPVSGGNVDPTSQVYVAENSKVTLNIGKTLVSDTKTGLSAFSVAGKTFQDGSQVIVNQAKTGVTNKGTITMNNDSSVGLYTLYGNSLNDTTGIINISSTALSGLGMYSEENPNIINNGIINLDADNSVGMYGKGISSTTIGSQGSINILNTGDINLTGANSIGISIENNKVGALLSDAVITNNAVGTNKIYVGGDGSVGIYAPFTIINQNGNIELAADNTVAIFGSDGAQINGGGTINLGTASQARIAYYLRGNGTKLASGLGDIKGYGIAVLSDGATIDNTIPTLDLTTSSFSDGGTGKIGLALQGNSIFNYTGDIKVGNSVDVNSDGIADYYAIALYTDNQNLSAGISNTLTAGAGGVGLYTQNGSNIKYSGTINVGNGTVAGTGIYVGAAGGVGSQVVLDNAVINIYGASGIGAYVDNLSTLTFGANSTMNFTGDGVGIFGIQGSIINDNGGVINSNGNMVERSRIQGGVININSDISVLAGGILGHAVNGEINVLPGITVTATGDSVTGLFGDGLKGAGTWTQPYEANNLGTIDFSNSNDSTAIYLNSARGQNKGTLKVKDDSIAFYGQNTGTEIYNAGLIEVGSNSVGLYGYNVDSINNLAGSTIQDKGTANTGIYNIGTSGTAIINNAGTIDLGDAGTGIYIENGNITNTGTINVGNKVVSSSVGIYAKDSVLNVAGVVKVGDNGIAFYGDNSILNLNGSDVNISNNGILGYGVNNTTINYNLGNKATSGNVFMYLVDSNVDFNGADITVSDNGMGVYQEGASLASGYNTLYINKNAAGMYGSGTNLSNTGNVVIQGINSAGLMGGNSNITNNSSGTITSGLSQTVGIYSFLKVPAVATSIINNGNISIFADDSIGIFASTLDNNGSSIGSNVGTSLGTTLVQNNGNISLGNASQINNASIGIYGTEGVSILNGAGSQITGGSNVVGIYSEKGTVTNDSTITLGDSSVGVYIIGGNADINAGSIINVGANGAIALYVNSGGTLTNYTSNINVGSGSIIGYSKDSGTVLDNRGNLTISANSVGFYSNGGEIINSGNLSSTSDGAIFLYGSNGKITNSGQINSGGNNSGIGIYGDNSEIINSGNIVLGNSNILDPTNKSIVGIYGNNSKITNSGSIDVGSGGVGIYSYNQNGNIINDSTAVISSSKEGAIGILVQKGNGNKVINNGSINLSGVKSIGISLEDGAVLENYGQVKVSGNDSIGIQANKNSEIYNHGIIDVSGNNTIAVLLKSGSSLVNTGTINLGSGTFGVVYDDSSSVSGFIGTPISDIPSGSLPKTTDIPTYTAPSIVNSGIIKVGLKFEVPFAGAVKVKVDPSTLKTPTAAEIAAGNYATEDINGKFLVSDSVKFIAPEFNVKDVTVTSDFTKGTNAKTYKLEDVFMPSLLSGGINSGIAAIISQSYTWDATPVTNSAGNVDIWMQKIEYQDLMKGNWYDEFGKKLDEKYEDASGKAGGIFDKIDGIASESEFKKTMGSLAGNVYANMNQREETIAGVLGTSLNLLQDSKNNTKENVKVNIIVGKGTLTEKTDGVVGYDYETTGVLALREVERTYKHIFGYSLGYLHTNFEFNDGNNSEEDADTIQLGAHNKYRSNDWILRNDLTARVSIHNIDRNIDWENSGRSEMNGKYEAYSITSDNNFGRELSLGKNASITPYGGLEATYMIRPTFSESGLESLEVEGNDAWSVKPKVGIELKASTNESKNGWKLKGALDISYGYELADLNEREYASLTAIEDSYHKLSKPEENRGVVKTKAIIGTEIENRYGIFLTGEYSIGNNNEDDYRAGVTLKAVF